MTQLFMSLKTSFTQKVNEQNRTHLSQCEFVFIFIEILFSVDDSLKHVIVTQDANLTEPSQ